MCAPPRLQPGMSSATKRGVCPVVDFSGLEGFLSRVGPQLYSQERSRRCTNGMGPNRQWQDENSEGRGLYRERGRPFRWQAKGLPPPCTWAATSDGSGRSLASRGE